MAAKNDHSDDFSNLRRLYNALFDQAVWGASICAGRVFMVQTALAQGIHPDTPVDRYGTRPLEALSLEHHTSIRENEGRLLVAHMLIEAGATLNVCDHKFLAPADYAMISPIPSIAAKIVMATIESRIRNGIAEPFRPKLDIMFATIPQDAERILALKHLRANRAEIYHTILLDRKNRENSPLLQLTQGEIEYWNALNPRDIDLPRASAALREKFEDAARLRAMLPDDPGQYSSKTKAVLGLLEETENEYRHLEWRTARKLHCN